MAASLARWSPKHAMGGGSDRLVPKRIGSAAGPPPAAARSALLRFDQARGAQLPVGAARADVANDCKPTARNRRTAAESDQSHLLRNDPAQPVPHLYACGENIGDMTWRGW